MLDAGHLCPYILYLNVEGLSANKICVISQLASRHKVLLILLHEAHCTNADQLCNTTLHTGWLGLKQKTWPGYVFPRETNLDPWWINSQRDQQLSGCVSRSMVARLSNSTNHQPRNSHYQPFQCFHTPVFMQVILIARTATGITITPAQMENAWLTGQSREIFPSCITLKMPLESTLVAGTLEPILTWLVRVKI